MKSDKTSLDLSKEDSFRVARQIIRAARRGLSPSLHGYSDCSGYSVKTSATLAMVNGCERDTDEDRIKNLTLVQLDLMDADLSRDEKEHYEAKAKAAYVKQKEALKKMKGL